MSSHVVFGIGRRRRKPLATSTLVWRVSSWTITMGEPLHLNARAVEFVAKPGRERHLRNCMRREVAELLKRQTGFAGIFVLTSHKEPRLIRVLSLWETAPQVDGKPLGRIHRPCANS